MLLGKRPGPRIRRKTSMAGISVDPTAKIEAAHPSDHCGAETITAVHQNPATATMMNPITSVVGGDEVRHHHVSPRKHQTLVMQNVSDDFLRTCSLCNRHLRHNRDIYMYRGDKAFCSLECREKQMKLDERKSKNGAVSSNKVVHI